MGIEIPESLQWVAKYILGAGDWPEGDETAMRRLADAWTTTANTLNTVDDEPGTALNAALTALSAGETHDAIAAYRDKLLSGDEAAFTAIRKWCEKQAELLEDGANDIEHTKLVIIGTMIVAAVEIGIAVATAWTGIGAASPNTPNDNSPSPTTPSNTNPSSPDSGTPADTPGNGSPPTNGAPTDSSPSTPGDTNPSTPATNPSTPSDTPTPSPGDTTPNPSTPTPPEPGPLLRKEQALHLIGQILVDHAPINWTEIRFSAQCTTSVSTYDLQIEDEISGTEHHEVPALVLSEVDNLRRIMYQPDRGTWLSMTITIASTGDYTSAFDYDSPPKVDQYTPEWTDETYVLDLREFPRSDQHIPDWLREKVTETRLAGTEYVIYHEAGTPTPPENSR